MSSTTGGTRGRLLLRLVQTLVSGLLLFWLLSQISWPSLVAALSDASPLLILCTCALYYVGVALSCWKWHTLLLTEGIDLPPGRLFRWYLIGAFAGNYLPTEVGGDIGRVVAASRATGRPAATVRSILAERLSGLAAMMLLAWSGLVVLLGRPGLALSLLLGAVAALVGFGFLMRAPAPNRHREQRLTVPGRLRSVLEDTRAATARLAQKPASLVLIAVLSLVFQLLSGTGIWLNMRAVGAELPVLPVILAAAMAGLAGLVPVTLSGWGVREGVLVALLTPVGASASAVLAGAVLGRVLQMLVTLPGAALIWTERKRGLPPPVRPTGKP